MASVGIKPSEREGLAVDGNYRPVLNRNRHENMKPRHASALAFSVAAIAALSACSAVTDYNRMLEENQNGRQAKMGEYSYCVAYYGSNYPSDCQQVLSAANSTVLLDPPKEK